MSHRPTRRPVRSCSRSWVFPLAVCAGTVLASVPGRAAVEWHPDVETAHAAARLSHRPVLAVFVASWGDAARTLESNCLASPEAEAVLATCFEPVRIDIDEHAELTRTAGVTHVPTACVLAADGTTIERFEMPGSSADFVKAAILAAQRAAAHVHGSATVESLDRPADAAGRPAPEPTSVTAAAFGSAVETVTDATRQARGSLSRVTAKVRDLSAFAAAETPAAAPATPATPPTPPAISQASRQVATPAPSVEPTSWPAEPAAAPPTAAAPTPTLTTIEPTATAMTPSTVAPWLDAPVVRAPVPPAPAPAPQPQGQAAALPPPERPAAPVEPAPSGLAAALQKPFALFGKQAADPPTLPPALPRSPLAGPAPAAAVADQAPDVHGSMPLGLEGYCPVTLVDRGNWSEGRAQWGARHRGRTYLFAGPEEQRTFLGNPDRYAPALSGDDPVLALDRGSSTPGQRRYGVTYQSRIYLFATPETRDAFTGDPGRYVARVAVAERPVPATQGTRLY